MDFVDCYGAPTTYLDYLPWIILFATGMVTTYLGSKVSKRIFKFPLLFVGLFTLLVSALSLTKLFQSGIVMRCG